jgi:hypothetical protein
MVKKKNAVTTMSFVNLELYFTCMKNRITNVALKIAIANARGKFSIPMSMNATATVTIVISINVPKITKYVLLGEMCPDMA